MLICVRGFQINNAKRPIFQNLTTFKFPHKPSFSVDPGKDF